MKAKLRLLNIGKIQGEKNFEFSSGKITFIQGPNASGKSQIIKAIAVIESFPIKSEKLKQEILKFGIGIPLINVNENKAEIELTIGKDYKKVELYKNGKIITSSKGNENFIYSCMLVENSRILENITKGNSDFLWIVKELSLAQYYDIIIDIINSYIEQSERYIEEINTKLSNNIEKFRKLHEIQQEKEILNEKINSINQQIIMIDKDKADPDKKEQYIKLENEIKKLEKNLKNIRKRIENSKNECENLQSESESLKNQILLNKELFDSLAKEKNKLEKIDIKKIQEEIIKLMNEKENLIKPKTILENEIQNYEKKLKLKGDLCPTCGQPINFDKERLKEELEFKEKEYQEIKLKIENYIREITKLEKLKEEKSKLNSIKKKYIKLENEIYKMQLKIKENEKKLNIHNNKIQQELNFEKQILQEIDEKKKLYQKIEMEMLSNTKYKKLADNKAELSKQLGSLIEEERSINNDININSKIDIWGINLNLTEELKVFLERLQKNLKKIKSIIELRAKEQKEGVAIRFNEKIEKLLKEMGLSNFTKIFLDLKDFQLKVFKENNKPQLLSSLSGAEKGIITGLLQISLKETYLPNNPFFIGDEVIYDLDQTRSKAFINYLKNLAKEKDWFVILTRIAPNFEIIEY
ncbi:MAG: hypothetical protein ACTSRP_06170 [Candidatus Helarchaeota archaeon]